MIRPLEASGGERKSKKRQVESSTHDGLKEFIEYMKNLKTMLISDNALSEEHIPAMCKHLSRHLTQTTMPRYACDQTGSRLIEAIFDDLAKRVKEQITDVEDADSASDSSKAAVVSILNLYSNIFCAVCEVSNIFSIVMSQYGSHTVEGLIRFYSAAFTNLGALLAFGFTTESHQKITDAFYSLTQCLFSLQDESRNFWTLARDLRATHVLRAVAQNLVPGRATEHFQSFIEKLLTESDHRQKLHTELYWDQQAALTLQVILTSFATCPKEGESDCKKLIQDNSLPSDDEALKKLLLDEVDTGRRMVEYFIENDFISTADYKRMFEILFNHEDIGSAIHEQLKPLFHKLLVSKGMTVVTNAQMDILIDCASLEENPRYLRNLIKVARLNKTHARSLMDALKTLAAYDASLEVDWEARREEFAEKKLGKIDMLSNFWYMLMCSPHKDPELNSLQYEGVSIATEIVSNFKAGHITTELLEELSQLFDRDENEDISENAEDAEYHPGGSCVFDDLARCKHGVMFLEQLVTAHLPDGIKRKIRILAGEQICDLCFDPNGSWLVATVVEHAEGGKEKNRLYRKLGEIRSDLLKRNPALYGRLGPEFRKFINPGQRYSTARFGS